MLTSTSGTVWGSVSYPRTLQQADLRNQTSDLQITRCGSTPDSDRVITMETKAKGKPITKSKLDAILHPTQKKQRGSLYLVLSVQNGYNMYSYHINKKRKNV